jgi:GntR family transcriptional regulator
MDVMTTIDRAQPMPLYAQLERALVSDMTQRGLKPGDRLPTEAEISETYSVSRATVRQALTRLVAEGRVDRVQGLGSFVARPRPTHQPLLTSFTENMRAQGFRPLRRVLVSETVPMPEEHAGIFGPETIECQYLCRILLADDRPVGISQTWLPREELGARIDLFRPEALESGSLYDLLQGPQIGIELHRGTEIIRAGRATEEQARLLECPPESPTLVVRRVTYTLADRPIESTVMTFAADRYEYRVNLFLPAH